MTQTIEQLTARVRELEEENARLKAECDDIKQVQFPRKLEAVAAGWKKQLAASQAYAEQLRSLIPARTPGGFVTLGKNYMEAEDKFNYPCSKMCKFKRGYIHKCEKALALSRDTSALDAYVEEKVKEIMK